MRARVLMVLESVFPTAGGGGAESQVRTLGLHLPGRDVGVSVVVPMVRNGPQVADDQVDGIPVHRIAYPKLPMLGASIMLAKLAWLMFWRRREYTFIHSHIAGNMSAVCCVMGWLLRKPVLVKLTGMTEMVGGILDPQPRFHARVKKAAMLLATTYQATSSQIQRTLVERGFRADKIRLIPNAVDTERFAALARNGQGDARQRLCGERKLVAVYVGRLEAEKDLDLMLRGWARAFRNSSAAALVLVGAGSLQDSLQQLAAELGIGSQVVFAGPSKSVERYLALADVGLLTSRAEGLSNTLLEYMASAMPVIGSRVSGTEDFVITGQTGWLFEAGNVDEFTRCLESAAELPGGQLAAIGENARIFVIDQASIAAVVTRLVELYTSAVPG